MLLANAYPNRDYRWHNSLKGISLQAEYTGQKVVFYEIMDGGKRQIPEPTIRKLFPEEGRKKNRPFLKQYNENFYAVLMRHRKKYKSQFQKLISDEKHDFSNQTGRGESSGDNPQSRIRRRKRGANMSSNLRRRRPPQSRS